MGRKPFIEAGGFCIGCSPAGNAFPSFLQWAVPTCPSGLGSKCHLLLEASTDTSPPSECPNVGSSCCLSFSLTSSHDGHHIINSCCFWLRVQLPSWTASSLSQGPCLCLFCSSCAPCTQQVPST